jgi:hypothetical protein
MQWIPISRSNKSIGAGLESNRPALMPCPVRTLELASFDRRRLDFLGKTLADQAAANMQPASNERTNEYQLHRRFGERARERRGRRRNYAPAEFSIYGPSEIRVPRWKRGLDPLMKTSGLL